MGSNVNVVKTFLNPKNFNQPESIIVKEDVGIVEAMQYVEKHPNTIRESYTIHRSGASVPDASTLYAAARVA
jgi:hypothetical protein